jgi:predicted HD phosphohydrolase
MNNVEAATFAQHQYAEDACRIRRWDDRAKVAGHDTVDMPSYRARVIQLMLPGA